MNAKQIRLLRRSSARIELHAGIAGLAFYRNLFALDPSLRRLFHTSIELQGRKLMEALSYTIATLENPEAVIPVLLALGRRHVGYGARDEHYATVIEALLQTFAEVLGREFTIDVRNAWREALTFVAETMKRGASPVLELRKGIRGSVPS